MHLAKILLAVAAVAITAVSVAVDAKETAALEINPVDSLAVFRTNADRARRFLRNFDNADPNMEERVFPSSIFSKLTNKSAKFFKDAARRIQGAEADAIKAQILKDVNPQMLDNTNTMFETFRIWHGKGFTDEKIFKVLKKAKQSSEKHASMLDSYAVYRQDLGIPMRFRYKHTAKGIDRSTVHVA